MLVNLKDILPQLRKTSVTIPWVSFGIVLKFFDNVIMF